MSIRTIDELDNALSAALVWRLKELTTLLALIRQSASVGPRRKALIRAGVALLYAHWEGFIKESANFYLEYVSNLRLKYSDLAPNFLAIGIRQLLNEAAQSKKASEHNRLVNFFLTQTESRCNLNYQGAIRTESNLSSKVLRDILDRLGFEQVHYLTKEKMLDERLLGRRNDIAHGEFLELDEQQYLELHHEVISLMQLFKNQVQNASSQKDYLRK